MQVTVRLSLDAPSLTQAIIVQMVYFEGPYVEYCQRVQFVRARDHASPVFLLLFCDSVDFCAVFWSEIDPVEFIDKTVVPITTTEHLFLKKSKGHVQSTSECMHGNVQ